MEQTNNQTNLKCSKCLGYGYYFFEECQFDRQHIQLFKTRKFQCEDCDGSGKYLKESNGYPSCEYEIDGNC